MYKRHMTVMFTLVAPIHFITVIRSSFKLVYMSLLFCFLLVRHPPSSNPSTYSLHGYTLLNNNCQTCSLCSKNKLKVFEIEKESIEKEKFHVVKRVDLGDGYRFFQHGVDVQMKSMEGRMLRFWEAVGRGVS